MEINIIQLGMIKTNCYLLQSEKAAVVIDPGFVSEKTVDFLNQNKDKSRIILITHAHFDHIGGAMDLRERTGTDIGIGINDNSLLSDTKNNLSDMFHAHVTPFSADHKFDDGEEFVVGDLTFKVIETPGHTPGGVSYLTGNSLFSGDTLFYESVGRTDFAYGDDEALRKSVKKLLNLDGGITVYPGHGITTDILHERIYNPCI